MIFPGTDLKYKIIASFPGFVIGSHAFRIVLTDVHGRKVKELSKADCFSDSEGSWYFAVENVRKGLLFVRFYAYVPDKDYNKQVRVITDYQLLCAVACAPVCRCRHEGPHDVRYEQVWTVDLDDGTYLADKDGNLILVDGRRVRFPGEEGGERTVSLDMTGNEFKTLVEGRSDDSHINTVPEVFDVMNGLDEDTQLTVMSVSDADDMMSRILGDSSSGTS